MNWTENSKQTNKTKEEEKNYKQKSFCAKKATDRHEMLSGSTVECQMVNK